MDTAIETHHLAGQPGPVVRARVRMTGMASGTSS